MCVTRFFRSKKKKKDGANKVKPVDRKSINVIPFWHRVSHNLKKVTKRYNVNVVFNALCKLAKICSMMTEAKPSPCSKKHAVQYTQCTRNVVYEIPLSCQRVCIGQTGWCYNERA